MVFFLYFAFVQARLYSYINGKPYVVNCQAFLKHFILKEPKQDANSDVQVSKVVLGNAEAVQYRNLRQKRGEKSRALIFIHGGAYVIGSPGKSLIYITFFWFLMYWGIVKRKNHFDFVCYLHLKIWKLAWSSNKVKKLHRLGNSLTRWKKFVLLIIFVHMDQPYQSLNLQENHSPRITNTNLSVKYVISYCCLVLFVS